MASYTVVLGKDISEIPEVLDLICGDICTLAKKDPEALLKKYQKAAERYVFLLEEDEDEL